MFMLGKIKLNRLAAAWFGLLFITNWAMGSPAIISSDVCVYGGTSGGVIAAVAAARLGKKVALICVNNHVGGMSSSGLGVTDVGDYPASIGGFAAEFYSRVGQAYGSNVPVYWFEPHVAEQTFLQMLSGAGVTLYTNEQLASVTMSNQTIIHITMVDGTTYVAREFIDATYEGDLMAQSGVSFTWGRESSSTYGESLAGVVINSVEYPCDPYVIPGDPASGLLPLIQTNAPGAIGQGDQLMQCYNFRLCLTQNPTNQIPITAANQLFRVYLRIIASLYQRLRGGQRLGAPESPDRRANRDPQRQDGYQRLRGCFHRFHRLQLHLSDE
jgi:hypothetical protein